MSRNKPSAKQSTPTTKDGRQIVYDSEMCITICERFLRGEDLNVICAKPPMPIAPIFLKWVQENQEAREIYRCAENYKSDRMLAEMLNEPFGYSVGDWVNEVRAKLERGHPVDYIDRKYTPPDWDKVYPLIGYPAVWSTEDRQAYNDLRDEFTQLLKPDDLLQLTWTKEAVDATWESAREAREKNAEPQLQYRLRRINEAAAKRQKLVEINPATASDHSRGFRAGFKHLQALDMAQSRKIKRRDNALRQIARWRDTLGGKAKKLSDKFVANLTLAERYGAAHLLADAETSHVMGEASEAASPLDASENLAQPLPPRASAGEGALPDAAAAAAPAIASSGETVDPAPALAPAGKIAQTVPPHPSAGKGEVAQPDALAQAAPSVRSPGETLDAAPSIALPDAAAEAAAPRPPAREAATNMNGQTMGIDWAAWLTGKEQYDWFTVANAARKEFKQPITSNTWLVPKLVVDCKLVRPDQVCPELARWLPKPQAPPTPASSSGEERK